MICRTIIWVWSRPWDNGEQIGDSRKSLEGHECAGWVAELACVRAGTDAFEDAWLEFSFGA